MQSAGDNHHRRRPRFAAGVVACLLAGLCLAPCGPARASLAAYDALITEDGAAGLAPAARLQSAVTLTGANSVAFDFGTHSGDATFEFILEGNPATTTSSYLAVGANSASNLRYEQWSNTGELGFTQLGVLDYLFTPPVPSPTEPTHVTYVWNAAARSMRLYRNGTLAGTCSGVTTDFAMPSGPGWLGANPGRTETMVGTIHRLTVYDGMVSEEVIAAHADAFRGVQHPPVILSFTATPNPIFTPGSTALAWSVRNATRVLLNGTDVTHLSALTVAPAVTTTYELVASNAATSVTARTTVRVNPAPVIRRFAADRSYVRSGDVVTLSWQVAYAQTITLEPNLGDVTALTIDGAGSVKVRPATATRYDLAVTNPYGADRASTEIHLAQPATHLVISEFLANDRSILPDDHGEFSGWIEIHNPTVTAVDLAGHFLTDDPNDPTRWAFPSTNLASGAYLVVFASGRDQARPGAPLHTNFRLRNAGEYLALFGPGPALLHAFSPAFPPQRPDIAYGILADDTAWTRYLGVPTPGAANDETPPPPEPVRFSSASGTFVEPFALVLSSADPAAEIRYTLDGSAPGPGRGLVYAGPLAIAQTLHVRAVAIADNLVSQVAGASYVRIAPDLAQYQSTLPILLIENFGAGVIPRKGWNATGAGIKQVPRQTAIWATFDLPGRSNTLTQTPAMFSLIGIRGRGAYSTEWRQKPYSVEAMDETGAELEVAPLGMPAHADWVLYFPDPEQNRDPTLLFNTFAYELSRNLGRYAARFRWVEAFINEDGGDVSLADRRGVYAIMERVARGKDRLDFRRLAEDGSTGGWLLNINRMDPEPDTGWPAPNGATQPWFFHTAGPDLILQTQPNTAYNPVPGGDQPEQWNAFINFDNPNGYVINSAQRAAIEGWFQQFERALYTDATWRDPQLGYGRYLDTLDFIDYFILNTLTRNGDGLLLSMFPWKGDDDRLRMGPAWDYNWSAYYTSGGPTGSLLHRSDRLWYARLFTDEDFMQRYIDRWWDLRRTAMSNAAMVAIIEGQAAAITPQKAVLNGLASPAEWRSRLDQMKSWLTQRADWIDSQYLRPPTFNQPGGEVPVGFNLILTGPGGTIYLTTDGSDPRAAGGALARTAHSYTSPIPINRPTVVQARVKNGNRWSGLTSGRFFPPQDFTPLVLTEIMYHPPDAGSVSGDDLEFLELKNQGTNRLYVGDLTFTSGISFTFSADAQLGPGQFFLLARSPASLQTLYPGVVVDGAYTGRLSDSGETLRLASASGHTVFEVAYTDDVPWPPAADGTGFSLQRRTQAGGVGDPASWFAAPPTPRADSFTPEPITIITHPLSQEILSGNAVTLSVAVDPSALLPVTYRWQREGADIPGGTFQLQSHAGFLRTDPAPTGDTEYRVIVSNPALPAGVASLPAVLKIVADADRDGLADVWELAHGLSAADPTDSELDLDRDGMTNTQEFLAGTDPTNALDSLKFESVTAFPGGPVRLTFRAVAKKTYTVEYTDDLETGSWLRLADIAAEPVNHQPTIVDPLWNLRRLYRIVTPCRP